MRVLLFGHKGYIGSEFFRQLSEIVGMEVLVASSRKSDGSYYKYWELERIIDDCRIVGDLHAVINCSAYIGENSVVECEKNKDITILANVMFPTMLGQICDARGISLCHLSSGCVFNGYKEGGWNEDDEIHLSFKTKCSFYTGTKVMAEEALKDVYAKYIWRIRLPFDNIPNTRNYLSKMMGFERLIVAENSLSNRQDTVEACIKCLLKGAPPGIYHVTNGGGIRADELAVLIRSYVSSRKNFQYFSSTEELDKLTGIPRSNTVLSNEKLAKEGIFLPSTRDSVIHCLRNWQGIIS